MTQTEQSTNQPESNLQIDDVITTQPELGPIKPDGGFGWVVYLASLFFQILIPCLIVNFGIFLAFTKLESRTNEDKNLYLWDENILYVPLVYCISKISFDSFSRTLISTTSTPRLIAVVGTCLTCASMLFMWMGMTATSDHWLFAPAGFLAGMGSSIILLQCETLLTQYFRYQLPILSHISLFVSVLGFIAAPTILGHHILTSSLSHVLLWYQAIILQGLIVSLFFRKPIYLQNRHKPQRFLSLSADDEEDILSRNARELQIKRENGTEINKIEQPGPSAVNWVRFEEEVEAKKSNWEKFEDESDTKSFSLAEEMEEAERPSPLFSDLPVNNNNSYAYDEEIVTDLGQTMVFAPNSPTRGWRQRCCEVLKEGSFYKSLLLMVANSYSHFVFFALYPSYLYIQGDSISIKQMSELVGLMSVTRLIFLIVVYWIDIDKRRRPICLWVFYWLGSVGYFMIADFRHEYFLLIGGALIVTSIGALEYASKPLLRLPAKGGSSAESFLLCIFSSLSLCLFLIINIKYKSCFRLVAILHFFTGSLWLGNYAYKRLRI